MLAMFRSGGGGCSVRTDVSEERVASIFRVESSASKAKRYQWARTPPAMLAMFRSGGGGRSLRTDVSEERVASIFRVERSASKARAPPDMLAMFRSASGGGSLHTPLETILPCGLRYGFPVARAYITASAGTYATGGAEENHEAPESR
jgi:hypothetical protein